MSAPRAELLIVNARLWSDGGTLPKRDALAVAGGRIRAVGVRSALESRVGPRTRVIDARGATVTPGLCDAHIHLLPWARQRSEVSLHDCGTREEALMRIRDFLARHPGGTPVAGRGWNADDWQEPPDRAALDAVAPERPVVLHSRDFHALWVNSAALAEAGVTRRTADVEGGVIERDAALEPTGVLRENAVRLVRSVTDRAAAAAGEPRDLLERAARELHALGITAVHDFERGEAAFTAMERFARGGGGSARVRVLQCVGPEDLDRVRSLRMRSGDGDDFFRVGALKLFADGTLGSRTAAMLEPYDGTSERGLDLLPGAELEADVARALDSGLSVAIHAIGDRACHRALDAFERTGDRRARIALPCRIEHAQLVAPADLPRFAALGVAAAMQPLHCTSDIGLAERFWGSRRAGA
ncbi:MAG: amidohydrolase [Candidatus Eisenbacteria bacterium]|nr:amidohydrolase [Candidatus Eisenbacteria bacterium]